LPKFLGLYEKNLYFELFLFAKKENVDSCSDDRPKICDYILNVAHPSSVENFDFSHAKLDSFLITFFY